jgi:predicted transcriptional regulator
MKEKSKEKSLSISIRIKESAVEYYRQIAEKERRTVSQVLKLALEDFQSERVKQHTAA